MEMKIPAIVISAFVVITVLAGVLIPVLDDATATTESFDNKKGSMFIVEKITTDSPYTFVWDISNRTVATVNGNTINLTASTLICTSSEYLIRYTYNSGSGNASIQSIGGSLGLLLSTSSATTGSLTVDNTTNAGYLTFTLVKDDAAPVVKTFAIGETYGISTKGDFVMKSSNQVAYLNGDSPVLAMGLTTFNGDYATGFYINGNPDDGFEVTNYFPSPATANVSDVTSDLSEVSNFKDLYTLKEIKFNLSAVSDPTITGNATYSYFIVPAEITAEKAAHLTDNQNAIMLAIPILVVIALLIAVAVVVLKSRDF